MSGVVPRYNKFACIAFTGTPFRSDRVINLGKGLSVHRNIPLSLADHWKEWLGTLEVEHLKETDLVILAMQKSKRPEVLDNENETLKRRCYYLLYGILMQSTFPYGHSLSILGANIDGKLTARQMGRVNSLYRMNNIAAPPALDEKVIRNAHIVAEGLRNIYSDDLFWLHFKRGIDAWIRAMKEREGGSRLHEFIRALEALIKPPVGQTRRQFAHRCKTFAGSTPQTYSLLLELFDLRSIVEHMNDWEDFLTGKYEGDLDRIAQLRTYQAECLAGHTYKRILSDRNMLENFKTDMTIDKFWQQPDHVRAAEWGTPLNIEQIKPENEPPI